MDFNLALILAFGTMYSYLKTPRIPYGDTIGGLATPKETYSGS
ncbi:hypothetical protein SX4_1750 [Vibrio mimicus SX-4]|nr:hypothetical protein SX4_1750 [Vibrio mimicus SX-4]